MSQKIIRFNCRGVEYDFNTQLQLIRRVGGYWMRMDHPMLENVKNAALNAQKLKECLL